MMGGQQVAIVGDKKPCANSAVFRSGHARHKCGNLFVDRLQLVGGELVVDGCEMSAGGCVALMRGELQPFGGFYAIRFSQGAEVERGTQQELRPQIALCGGIAV